MPVLQTNAPPAPAAPPTMEQLTQQLVDLANQLTQLRAERVIVDRQLRHTDAPEARAQLMAERSQVDAQIRSVNDQISAVRSRIGELRRQQVQTGTTVPPTPPRSQPVRQFDPDLVMGFFFAVVFCIGLPISIGIAKRLARGKPQPTKQDDIAPRLDRLEQAMDAVAIEVERISEGQRFVTKILAEKQQAIAEKPIAALGAGPIEAVRVGERQGVKQSITPH